MPCHAMPGDTIGVLTLRDEVLTRVIFYVNGVRAARVARTNNRRPWPL